ncbi:MAG: hypothetical protein J1E57_10485, partial [Prevotella sp.]|nr:hypothetical protein [Prevotella sp.]
VSMLIETASDGNRDYMRLATYMGDRGFNRGLGLQVVRLHKLPNHAKSCQMQTKTDSGIAKFNTFALCKRCYAPSFAKESVL